MTVQIGALTNVPAPGDPIRSPWAQDVTKLGVHVFADKATLLAQWPSPPNGAHAYTTAERVRWVRYGGAWNPDPPQTVTITGTALIGTYDAAKPVKVAVHKLAGGSDANGIMVAAFPAGTVAVLSVQPVAFQGATAAIHLIVRSDLGPLPNVSVQARRNSDETAVANAVYAHVLHSLYQ